MRPLVCFFMMAALGWAGTKTETGEINGASFRIDMPESWNGVLIMFCHGYSPAPGRFENPKPNPQLNPLVGQGFAVAQSGYAAGGWAIEEGVQDTQALRRYFGKKYGAAKETYVMGGSMGGFLTMVLLESYPNDYDGGLALCGPLAPASVFMARRSFDRRVVFDYYFPGALPPPDKVPGDYAMSPELTAKILALMESKPAEAEGYRRWAGLHSNKDAAGTIVFLTYVLKEVQQRGGGNPFDNRNIIYEGSPDDNALNDGVKRYASDARAAEYVRQYYTPTGRLTKPMLAMHTTYDPLVPAWTPNMYSQIAAQAGSGELFVQQYVKRDGHCAFTPEEVARGFAALREWKGVEGDGEAAGGGRGEVDLCRSQDLRVRPIRRW